MDKRIRKPIVKEDTRREWLRRFESGESLEDIAKKESFDIRTVKRQVDKAEEECASKEVRQAVLRNALLDHFQDMVYLVEKVMEFINAKATVSLEPEKEKLLDGLRQHLPRSPIFKCLNRWELLQKGKAEINQKISGRLLDIKVLLKLGGDDIKDLPKENYSSLRDILNHQIECWSTGVKALDVSRDFVMKDTGELVDVNYGRYNIGMMSKDTGNRLKNAISKIEQKILKWEEVKKLGELYIEETRLRNKLLDELQVIKLRRVVPGRCRYCPI
ncbi:MAG: hypothetical protein A2158_02240 [Chloroflexi bacterium RBG_13_46_14]|nr:MAG: hypothetical protein A2158_02240 [Chloroflexi bacterium RBG_13_46_14]